VRFSPWPGSQAADDWRGEYAFDAGAWALSWDRNAIVLAITPSTATGWVKAAGGDWNRYIAYVADRSQATTNPTARQEPSR
jgi:hypothetical protein